MKVVVYSSSHENIPAPEPRFENVEWTTERPTSDYYLEYYDGKIVLQKQEGPENPLFIDFREQWGDWRRQKITAKTDLLAKACAITRGKRILDLTMGLANDSLKMVFFGANVMGIEKQPLIFELVRDALFRCNATLPEDRNLTLDPHFGDSISRAREYVNEFEVFYFDPMFQVENRSALPKKKMQFLNEIIGENSDEEFLPTVQFLQDHKKRVVIKRHPDAPHFAGLKPIHVFEGKKIRFEIF